MKRITIGLTVAVVLALLAFVIVRADTRGPAWSGHRWHRPGPAGFLVHALNLSDAQEAQIRTLWQAERPHLSAHVHEFLAESKEMSAIAVQEKPDSGKVQEIADREAATIATLLVEKQQLQAKIYWTVLNPEQRTRADELQKRWESRLDHAADRMGTAVANK